MAIRLSKINYEMLISTCKIYVAGISRSARGYCINFVLETMKTYSSEDGLTEEALVAKLRTCRYHHLFLHTSLRNNFSGSFKLLTICRKMSIILFITCWPVGV